MKKQERGLPVDREEVKRRLLGITELGCPEVKFGYAYEVLSGRASWKVPSLSWCRLLGKPSILVMGLSKQEADREICIPRDARSPNLQSWWLCCSKKIWQDVSHHICTYAL